MLRKAEQFEISDLKF